MLRTLFRKATIRYFIRRGHTGITAPMALKSLEQDLQNRDSIGFRRMLNAYANGFSATTYYQLQSAGVDLSECMPDIHYFKLHPINGRFSRWIDDKLTPKYILAKFDQHLPRYYYHLGNGAITPLMDGPRDADHGISGLLELARHEGELALKPNAGSRSVGFFKLESADRGFQLNGQVISEPDLVDLISSLNNYVVTEYIHAHSFLKRIYPDSPNILRLITVNLPRHEPEVIASYLRIGQKSAGFVELTRTGGIFAGVDITNGKLFDPKLFDGLEVSPVVTHPDTKSAIDGVLPDWSNCIGSVLEICRYLPNMRFMGFDLIITEAGFKIIEINSLPGISYIQHFHPILRSQAGRDLFKTALAGNQ